MLITHVCPGLNTICSTLAHHFKQIVVKVTHKILIVPIGKRYHNADSISNVVASINARRSSISWAETDGSVMISVGVVLVLDAFNKATKDILSEPTG